MKLRRAVRTIAVLGAVVTASATTAWAAPKADVKPYRLSTATPSSVGAGSTATFSVDITNESDQQQIGSVNIRVPELRVISSNASADGTAAEFRNLSLSPGATTTLSFTATASCVAGTFTWALQVKQSNDFNGPPGNDFVLAPGSALPTTTITGSCRLEFLAHPADTSGPGVTITSVALDPTGAPVSVRVLDGAGQPTSATGLPITLGLAVNGGGVGQFGVTRSTVNGTVTFPGISLSKYGTYRFNATSAGATTATSSLFNVWQVVENCATTDCHLVAGVSGSFSSTLDVDATSGVLGVSSGGRAKPICGPNNAYDTQFNHAPGTTTGNAYGAAAGSADKLVTLVVEKKEDQRQPNNGASFYQVCYAAPLTASPSASYLRPGTVAVQDPTTSEWVWVLPDCGPQVPGDAACVLSRNKDNAGRVIVTFRLAPGDPTWW